MPDLRLRLYDTLTARLKPLVPKHPGIVGIYTCGPTTYDVAHVGHARAALAPDVLVRHLKSQGMNVNYVRNITDVDDKILKRAEESKTTPLELSARMAKLYQEDVAAIGCATPDVEPKVSDHVGEIVTLIEKLISLGAAYECPMPNGARDVYYAVRAFPGYGKLSKRNIDDMRVGARVEANDDKRDPLDFALWKGCVGDAWGFDSPWGRGRPGWHIECSAMSERYLGHGFDVHVGGMDLVFPHHENEIAQSEAAHPGEGDFVETWIHNGFVTIDKEKMSKSLKNFVTIRDVLARNDAEALRYFLLGVHYRGPINLDIESSCPKCGRTRDLADPNDDAGCASCGASWRILFPGIVEAERRVDYLYQALGRLDAITAVAAANATPDATATRPLKMPKELVSFGKLASEASDKIAAALDDDLNTPVALAVLAELAKAANELADLGQKRKKDAELQRALPFAAAHLHVSLQRALAPLGLLQTPAQTYRDRTQAQRLELLGLGASDVEAKLTERTAARNAKDFARADSIRGELDALGIEVADGLEGSTWRVSPISQASRAATTDTPSASSAPIAESSAAVP